MDCKDTIADSRGSPRLAACAGLFVACLISFCTHAAESLAVLYPEIREPYQSVFASILEGIREEAGLAVRPYLLREQSEPDELRRWLVQQDSRAIIALGRRGLAAAGALDGTLPVVGGAILAAPASKHNGITGISLVPDPDIVFKRLRELAPQVNRVIVVFNPGTNASLMRLARAAARDQRLLLQAIEVGDLREAAEKYREVLSGEELGDAALWLLQDPTTIDGKLILPLILEKAWKKRLVVVASNPAYVRRGALFSLYPDNEALGRSLVRLVDRIRNSKTDGKLGTLPLRDVLIAVNIRTASHLRLKLTAKQRKSFDLVFPAR